MKNIINKIKESPVWLISVLFSVVAIFFFIYLPFQINLFPKGTSKKIYYVDNISPAHLKIIKKFNELLENEIAIILQIKSIIFIKEYFHHIVNIFIGETKTIFI